MEGNYPILRDVSWFARQPISEAKLSAASSIEEYIYKTRILPMEQAFGIISKDENDNEIKNEEDPAYPLDKQLDLGQFIQIHFQVDRYAELEYQKKNYKAPKKGFTAGKILEHIYRFYASEIPEEELEQVIDTDDSWGYSAKAKKAFANKTVLYREQVMGDCIHFEGLQFIGFSKERADMKMFRVMFGS